MNKQEVLKKISGAHIIKLVGSELTEYRGFTIYINGLGEDRMYTVFVDITDKVDQKFVRLDKDELKKFVVEKVTVLGYTLGEVSYS